MKLDTGIASTALVMLQDAAAGAYCTSLGQDYEEKRGAILQEITEGFGQYGEDLKRMIARVCFAGLNRPDPKFISHIITVFATDMALRAAAKHCGEPPLPSEDEAKPADAAVH